MTSLPGAARGGSRPGTRAPDGHNFETTNLTDVRLDPIEGGWQLIGHADGEYAVKAT
ncbi:hypothetical protein GCM10020255_075170 [Rhodococcus baikonurensis]